MAIKIAERTIRAFQREGHSRRDAIHLAQLEQRRLRSRGRKMAPRRRRRGRSSRSARKSRASRAG